MRAVAINDFIDKQTAELVKAGDVVERDEARIKELEAAGFVKVEKAAKPAPKKAVKAAKE